MSEALVNNAEIWAANHGGEGFITAAKMVEAMKAHALVEYSEELLANVADYSPLSASMTKKALQALVKAYYMQTYRRTSFKLQPFMNSRKGTKKQSGGTAISC